MRTRNLALLPLLLLVLGFATGARADHDESDLRDDIRVLRAQVEMLTQRHASKPGADRRALRAGLEDLERKLDRLDDKVRRMEREERRRQMPREMDPASFSALQDAVARQPFSDGRLSVIASAAAYNWFTVGQVRSLIDSIRPSDDRLRAVELLWPRVLDRQNAFLLEQAFPFSGDRARLRRILV